MNGDLLAYVRRNLPFFWQQVAVAERNVCWPYAGHLHASGYGMYGSLLAHRFAWMSVNGRELDAEEVIRHRCDFKPCCNPAHLLAGTQLENMRDVVDRTYAAACKNGHPRTPATTGVNKKGHRRCLVCDRAAQRARRQRDREQGAAA